MKRGRILVPAMAGILHGGAALAAEERPRPWEWWHQPPATPLADRVFDFHFFLLWVMVAICVLVVALLAYVLIRFNARRHPTPSRTTHNTVIEVTWTVVPVLILVAIAIPSFQLLYYSHRIPDADMTLKVTGHQWYWDYQYPDNGGFTLTSLVVPEEELKPGQPRLLTVDNPIVLPVDTVVRIQVTGGDVIHSWAVPSFGIKIDAIPGRLNETWARIEREGTYYGQCSELCGTGHDNMPIEIKAVSKEAFAQWVKEAQAQFAATSAPAPVRMARNRTPATEGLEEARDEP